MIWQLPEKTCIHGREYPFHTDYRVMLKIIGFLNGDLPEYIRWQVFLPSAAAESTGKRQACV